MSEAALLSELSERFVFLKQRPSLDHPAVDCPQSELLNVITHLRDEAGFDFLMDVTAIDAFDASPRFTVVYHLFSSAHHGYIRVASPCLDDVEPRAASLTDLWPGADWHERETFDMFGIVFEGHPDLRRILMWDTYPYHPLRKDFPLAGHEVDLPAPDVAERTGVKVKPAPMMGGPFHSPHGGPMSRREPRADDESWTERREKDASQALPEQPREFRPSDL